jgi:putative isomerase
MSSNDYNRPVNINGSMFKRAGAWFGLFQRGSVFGDITINLGTCHGMSAKAPDKSRLIDIYPTFEGRKVPYSVTVYPAELTMVTNYGNVRFTFADKTKLMAEGDPGMGLLFEKIMVKHETVRPKKDGAWEALFRLTSSFIFKGLEGSSFDFNDGKNYWNWETLSSDRICGRTHPGPDGRFTLVMEEFPYAGIVRDSYPKYAEAKASMQAQWESFYSKMPKFKEPFEEKRFEVEYTLWSYLCEPYGAAKYTLIQMFAGIMASQWQLCQNAVALQENFDVALDLLLAPLDRASEEGQLADSYDDFAVETQMIKPPIHGWAIKQIMKHHDLLKECPKDKLEMLYKGVGAWGDWFMNYKDDDGDGLPTLEHGDECGLDDSTLFLEHMQVTSPDLAAYLVILFEAVGDLAKLLNKPEAETQAWYDKSAGLLKRMIDKLWDGEHFVGLVPGTDEKLYSGSIVHYIPAILGNRLPKNIIDKMVDDLTDTEKFLSPYGLASEDMTSDYYYPNGMSIGRGVVVPPAMIYICTGLWETHRREDARLITENYLNGLIKTGFPFLINPKVGFGSGGYYGGSWPRCAYVILGRMASEG